MDRITELRQRAEAMPALIKNDTPAAEAERIEREHQTILDEVRELEGLRDLCRSNSIDYAPFAAMPIAEAKRAALNAMAERDERTPMFPHHPVFTGDSTNRAAEDFLFAKMTGRRATGPAERYNGMSLTEFGRSWLAERGERVSGIGRNRIADQLLTTRAAYHTTSDFPTLLQSAGNRVLQQAYESAVSPLMQIARPRTVPDFRAVTVARLSEAPSLELVNEAGEIKYGSRTESKESYRVFTYARIFSLSRQAIVNDDLQAFGEMATAWGRSAANREAEENGQAALGE